MAGTVEIQDVFRRGREGSLAWQDAAKKDQIITVHTNDVRYGSTSKAARGYQLRLDLKKGDARETFDGFTKADIERLGNLFSTHFGTMLQNKEVSLRGWNWGKVELQGQDLTFLVAGRPAFDVPVAHVHNTSINKTEVALEFLQADTAAAPKQRGAGDADELVEMRIYIPGSRASARKRDQRIKKEANGGAGDVKDESESDDASDGEAENQLAAQAFHDEIKEKAEVGHVSGESMVTFNEVHCVTPRGRYDIDVFPAFFRLRSKSYDYKILYSSIVKLFLLSKTDEINVLLVANLDPPIRQGQTRYPYLVMQFDRSEDMEAELNLTSESLAEYQAKGVKLDKRYDAPAFEVVTAIFRQLSGKKPYVADGKFQSHDGQNAVKCSLKANEGHLYFLDKQMLYIAKQPLLVAYNEIHQVKFERVTGVLGSSRTFDLRVVLRSGDEHIFSSVARDEHQPIWDYLKELNISVKNELLDEMVATQSAITAALKAAETSDSDMSEDDAPRRTKGGDDDSDEEVDDDFKANSDDSDVAEEFDENYKSSGSDDEGGGGGGGNARSDDDDDGAEGSGGAESGSEMDVDESSKSKSKRPADEAKGGAQKKLKK